MVSVAFLTFFDLGWLSVCLNPKECRVSFDLICFFLSPSPRTVWNADVQRGWWVLRMLFILHSPYTHPTLPPHLHLMKKYVVDVLRLRRPRTLSTSPAYGQLYMNFMYFSFVCDATRMTVKIHKWLINIRASVGCGEGECRVESTLHWPQSLCCRAFPAFGVRGGGKTFFLSRNVVLLIEKRRITCQEALKWRM